MTQRHKWADVLIAYAEGRKVQVRHLGDTEWVTTGNLASINHPNYEYRIKPEKKTGWVNIYKGDYMRVGQVYCSRTDADNGSDSSVERLACIQIQFEEGEGL